MLKVFPNGVVMLSATKNKKRRRFALDPITLAVLLEQKARAEERCAALGVDLAPDAFVWSQSADHCEPWRPDRVSGAFTAFATGKGCATSASTTFGTSRPRNWLPPGSILA